MSINWKTRVAFSIALMAAVAACSSSNSPKPGDSSGSSKGSGNVFNDEGNAPVNIGSDGFTLFGGATWKKTNDEGTAAGIGVNAFLWRASLDTLGFMPLASADPFGGVILTDWYAPPESPAERFKMSVFIMDRTLRADGVRVQVFRQVRGGGASDWADAPVDAKTGTDMENAILTRARELRTAAAATKKD